MMGQFEKGKSGNPNGRPPGSISKGNAFVKDLLTGMMWENADKLKEDFKQLKGKDAINAMTAILPYLTPRLQSTSMDLELEALTDEQLDELYERIMQGVR